MIFEYFRTRLRATLMRFRIGPNELRQIIHSNDEFRTSGQNAELPENLAKKKVSESDDTDDGLKAVFVENATDRTDERIERKIFQQTKCFNKIFRNQKSLTICDQKVFFLFWKTNDRILTKSQNELKKLQIAERKAPKLQLNSKLLDSINSYLKCDGNRRRSPGKETPPESAGCSAVLPEHSEKQETPPEQDAPVLPDVAIAIGKLCLENPEEVEKPEETEKPEEIEKSEEIKTLEEVEKPGEIEKPEEIKKLEEVEKPDEIEKLAEVEKSGEIKKPEEVEKPVSSLEEESEEDSSSLTTSSTSSSKSEEEPEWQTKLALRKEQVVKQLQVVFDDTNISGNVLKWSFCWLF